MSVRPIQRLGNGIDVCVAVGVVLHSGAGRYSHKKLLRTSYPGVSWRTSPLPRVHWPGVRRTIRRWSCKAVGKCLRNLIRC